jgi:hypothetical protein
MPSEPISGSRYGAIFERPFLHGLKQPAAIEPDSERIPRRLSKIPLCGAAGLASESKRHQFLTEKIPCSLLQGLQFETAGKQDARADR